MKKLNFVLISLTVLAMLFSCTASTVIIDGTFEVNIEGRIVTFHLKRQAHDNSVLGMLKSDLMLPNVTISSGTFFAGVLYDAEDFILLSIFWRGGTWNFRVLDNGAKLESVNRTPKVFFKRK